MKQVTVRKKCIMCKDGEMVGTGSAFTTLVTYLEHKCNKCKHKEQYQETFPYTYQEFEKDELRDEWE